jgi:RimJ/RimL family protein N-acetyltransferase
MADPLPTLETPRLHLRCARSDDLKTLQEHWNDPRVRKYLFDDKIVDESLASSVLGACLAGVPEGHGLWLLIEKSTHAFLGCVALIPTSIAAEYEPKLTGFLEPMVSLVPNSWGHGLAAEGLSAVLHYAFHVLAVTAVAAANDVPNTASERMLLNAGFSVVSEVDGPRYRLRTYMLQRQTWQMRDEA